VSRAAAGLALLLLTASAAAAQDPLAARPRGLPSGYLGTTRCVAGVPTSLIDPHLDPATRRETEAHEAVHRRQLAGDCERRLAAIARDPLLRLDYETEAYCGGLDALGLDEMRHGVAVERLREGLYDFFDDLPAARIDTAVARYCNRTGLSG
jgi:hypothetical protein